jgi:DNA-binding CsgD family transcriptional regulator
VTDEEIFGRGEELAALDKLLGRASGAAAALLIGEAGIGKSSLLEYSRTKGRERGFCVLSGHCYDAEETGPYFPFFEMLKQLGADAGPNVKQSYQPVTGLGEAGSSWLGKDARKVRSAFVRDLSETFVALAQGRPLLLLVDDIQWADVGTLLMLNCLVDIRAPNLVLLCAERSDEADQADRTNLRMALRSKVQRLELSGLDLNAVRELVCAELGKGMLSTAEVRTVAERTRGNPLFIRELLRHFLRQGKADVESIGDFASRHELPANLSAVIDLHLGRLADSVLAGLQAASIFNGPFTTAAVGELLQIGADEARDALDLAVEDHIIVRVHGVGGDRYGFAHQLFAKRLYEQLPAAARRQLHGKVFESAKAGRIIIDQGELARHSALGSADESAAEAVDACTIAAERAERLVAFDEAIRYWQLAISCSTHAADSRKAELRRRLGWACWAEGRWEQAVDAWREAAALFEAVRDDPHLAEVSLALADVHRWRLQLDEAKRWALRAVGLPLATHADRALASALIGDTLAIENRQEEARPYLNDALDHWAEGGCSPGLAWWLGHGLLMLGELSTALQVGEQAIEEARRQGATETAALIASGMIVSDLGSLNLETARRRLKIAEEGTNPYDSASRISLLVSQAAVFGYLGRWISVIDLADDWAADFRLAGRYQVATACMTAAVAHAATGGLETAEGLITRAMPNTGTMRPAASLYLAELRLRAGRNDEARTIANAEAPAILGQTRLAASRALLGHIAASLGDERLARACYDSLLTETRSMVMVYSSMSVKRVLGRLAASLRDWPAAIRHFEDAIQELERGGALSELAWALTDCASMRRVRNRRGDGLRAQGLDARATGLFSQLGMWDPLQRTGDRPVRRDPFGISARELEVLELVAHGMRNREVADRLTISDRTVQRHLENIFEKMGVDGRTEAVMTALREGVIAESGLTVARMPRPARAQ